MVVFIDNLFLKLIFPPTITYEEITYREKINFEIYIY